MSSAFRLSWIALLLVSPVHAAGDLRVCADPNNLPFSNAAQAGFENRVVAIVADELNMSIDYVWWAQRRGMVTEALNGDLCDVIAGFGNVPGVLLTYPPYYRSAYAFVTRAADPTVSSLDDPALRTLRVGVQLVGDDGVNTPPAEALARRGIVNNVTGYSVLGDYGRPNPPARIIDAVAAGTIDVAIAWGPLAGYFATRELVPLAVVPIAEAYDAPDLAMAFDISMALRLDEGVLRKDIEGALNRRKADIDAVLKDYGVPRLDGVTP